MSQGPRSQVTIVNSLQLGLGQQWGRFSLLHSPLSPLSQGQAEQGGDSHTVQTTTAAKLQGTYKSITQ